MFSNVILEKKYIIVQNISELNEGDSVTFFVDISNIFIDTSVGKHFTTLQISIDRPHLNTTSVRFFLLV